MSLSPPRARQGSLHSHYGALPVGREWLLRAGRETISDDRSQTGRSEEHTSELQSLMRISYAVFCLKKKKCENTLDQEENNHAHNKYNPSTEDDKHIVKHRKTLCDRHTVQ